MVAYHYKPKPGETMFGGGKGILGLGQRRPPPPETQQPEGDSKAEGETPSPQDEEGPLDTGT